MSSDSPDGSPTPTPRPTPTPAFRIASRSLPGSPSKPATKKRQEASGKATTTQTAAEGYREHESPDPFAINVLLDDPATRATVPLPITLASRMEVDNFVMPNPNDLTNLPTHADENPHNQTSNAEYLRLDPLPEHNALMFTMSVFPRLVLPLESLLFNLSRDQIDILHASPDDHLAVMIYGAGPAYFKEHPTVDKDIIEVLTSLMIDTPEIDIAFPVANRRPRDAFDGPWPLILSGASQELILYALWVQTFSVNPELTFSVLPFAVLQSWQIMHITSPLVRDTVESQERILGAVKKRLWNHPEWCRLALLAWLKEHPSSTISQAECKVMTTASLALRYVGTENEKGNSSPYFLLTGKPISEDQDLNEKYNKLIRSLKYFEGLHELKVYRRFSDCRWCKSDSHAAYNCPFPRVDGWLGQTIPMTQIEDERFERSFFRGNEMRGQSSRGGGPYNRGGRGFGGRGGRGRGGLV